MRIVKICRYRDHSFRNRRAKVALRITLQLAQHLGANLGRRVLLAANLQEQRLARLEALGYVYVAPQAAHVPARIERSCHGLCTRGLGRLIARVRTRVPADPLAPNLRLNAGQLCFELAPRRLKLLPQLRVVLTRLGVDAHLFELHVQLENLGQQLRRNLIRLRAFRLLRIGGRSSLGQGHTF